MSDQSNDPTPAPNGWTCGCGWVNGINLAYCARCERSPNGGNATPAAPTDDHVVLEPGMKLTLIPQPDITVNYPGTKVLLGSPGETFPGEITRIQICPGPRVMYEVEWWSGRDRKSHWFNPLEITLVTEPIDCKIGFHNGLRS